DCQQQSILDSARLESPEYRLPSAVAYGEACCCGLEDTFRSSIAAAGDICGPGTLSWRRLSGIQLDRSWTDSGIPTGPERLQERPCAGCAATKPLPSGPMR